jgi:PAS domain S-box-containing protein
MVGTAFKSVDRLKAENVSTLAGLVLLMLSTVVLIGWALHIRELEDFVAASTEMKANSAAAMMLASIALLRRTHRDLLIYSFAVSLIGALTLVEYFWGTNLRIDELLFRDTHYFQYPGRMSQYTSIGFVLLGISLLLMKSRRRWLRQVSRGIGIVTGALGTLAIVAHAYDSNATSFVQPHKNVSIPTALCFMVGAIGVEYANPSEGIVRLLHAKNQGGAMLRHLLPAGFAVAVLLGFWVVAAQIQNHWEIGFSVAFAGCGVTACFLAVIVLIAADLERQDLARDESEQRFFLAVKTAPVMIWMADTGKLCTYFSPPWLEFTGRTMESELGNGWADGVHSDDLNRCMATYVDSFDRREPFQMQYRLRRHDGEYRWIFDTGVPRFNKDDSFAGYIGSCIDITDHKVAEEAVADLERRVLSAQEEERTRIARELHDDINQQIAILGWELRSVDRRPSGKERRSHKSLDALADRLTRIASDIQTISHRLHSSHLEYLGLASAAEVLCREFRTKQGVEIALTCEGIPRNLPKDIALCLYRVLQEALQNAVKHSGVQQYNVELVGDGTEVRLTVSDNGVGFDSTRTERLQGLGLISMRERLRLAHGDFRVESEPGHGTTIRCCVKTITDPAS